MTANEPLDVWLRHIDDEDEAESEANCFYDEDDFVRVEWYHTAVGQVDSKTFATHAQARRWLEAEGFQDFSS